MLPENKENGLLEVAAIPALGIDKVKFENVKRKYVCDPANPSYVMAEFILDKDVQHSTRDWIGLFPRGWNSLFQSVAFEYVICQAVNEEERRWKVAINLNFVKEDLYHPEFQFVFVSCDLQILGTSHFFRFYKCEADAQAAYKKIYKNDVKNVIQNLEEVQITELENKFATRQNKKMMRKREHFYFQNNCGSSSSAKSVYSDSALLCNKNTMRCFPNCRNCDRIPEFINRERKLYLEIKNLAEEKRELEMYITFLKEKLELSLAAQKKLSLVAEYEKREKMTYQAIASSVLKQISDCSLMRMNNGNLESLTRQVYNNIACAFDHAYNTYYPHYNQTGMVPAFIADVKVVLQQPFNPVPFVPQQHQRRPKPTTSSMSSRHLEMKAIIGAQCEKIRFKEARIAELEAALREAERPLKVTAVVTDVTDKQHQLEANDLKTNEPIDLNNNS